MTKRELAPKLQDWGEPANVIASRMRTFRWRELGMNPKKLGKIDNDHHEPRKAPLPQFIEQLYEKRFGRPGPEVVTSIEERARARATKKTGPADAPLPVNGGGADDDGHD